VLRLLHNKGARVACAESCTGGLVGHLLTREPGASQSFMGSVVTYSNASKIQLLGVPEDTIMTHGAVSEETARAMASGAREALDADYAVSITGIAGPSGGTDDKPVGTVYVGLSTPESTVAYHHELVGFRRDMFQRLAAFVALDRLRRELI